jgi:uncharacterized protein (TIGR02246 family)
VPKEIALHHCDIDDERSPPMQSNVSRLNWALLSCVVLAACVQLPNRDPRGIRELVASFIAAVNAADTERFVGFFAADATAFLPSNASASRRRGIEQIRRAVAPVFAQGPRIPSVQASDLVITSRDDFAVASFDAGTSTQHARRTLVLQRMDGQWKIIHLHASNVAEVQ